MRAPRRTIRSYDKRPYALFQILERDKAGDVTRFRFVAYYKYKESALKKIEDMGKQRVMDRRISRYNLLINTITPKGLKQSEVIFPVDSFKRASGWPKKLANKAA